MCTGLATVDECTIGAALALAEREEINAGERDEKTTPQKSDAPQRDSQEATGKKSPEDEQWNPLLTEITVIAMGRLGGAENGFGSDADVMFVHRPRRRCR